MFFDVLKQKNVRQTKYERKKVKLFFFLLKRNRKFVLLK